MLPLRLGLELTVGEATAKVGVSGPLPVGELALIAFEALTAAAPYLLLTVLWGAGLLWLWTVLWHAGVATFEQRGAGKQPPLSVLLGLGLVTFGRYLRLSLAAVTASTVAMVLLWGPLGLGIGVTYHAMAETWALALAAAGVLVTLAWLPLAWSATLRGVWILARPERRSAALAWLRGLADSLRWPLRSPLTVLAWLLAAVLATAVAELLAQWTRPLSGVVGLTLSLVGGLARAFCWVALLGSFGPGSRGNALLEASPRHEVDRTSPSIDWEAGPAEPSNPV